MASRVRVLVAASVLAGTLALPAAAPARASTRCDPLLYNSKSNSLRQKASNGALLVEYHVTVTWCTAPNNSVQVRVYSPQRASGYSVTPAGLLVGWSFDRVLGEQRTYFTYKHVPLGGYFVNTQVNFIRCLPTIIPVCSNHSGWLHTYVRWDRTATAVRGWN
jgi:hypothetical protein